MNGDEKILYREDDVCALLSLSRSGVRRAMGRGELRGIKVGRALRFQREELDRFVEALETERDGQAA